LERGTSKTSWNATFQNAGFARRAALRCRAACDPGKNFLSGASRGLFGNRNRGTRLELRARWANSNPNRNSKTNADSNPNSKTNADSNPNSNSKTNADSNPNPHSNINADSYIDTNVDSNPNCNPAADADSYINTNVDTNPNCNPAADADSISNANPNSTSGNGASRGVCHRQLRGGCPRRGA
jgi:hypothetical protein